MTYYLDVPRLMLAHRVFYARHWAPLPCRNVDNCQDCRRTIQVVPSGCFSSFINQNLRSFGGVILVSLSDSVQTQPASPIPAIPSPRDLAIAAVSVSAHAPRPVLGDFLALLSALFYSLYVTLLKVRVRSESRMDMQLFFGFVGLLNVLTCWPIGILLHITGIEVFEFPSTERAVGAIFLNVTLVRFPVPAFIYTDCGHF